MNRTARSRGIPLNDILVEHYKDPEEAKVALEVALEEFEADNDVESLLDTLRLVARAQGGLAAPARGASVSRQAGHEAPAPEGNPRLRDFQSLLDGLGLQMSFKVRPVAAGRK